MVGWIKLHRKIRGHCLFREKRPFSHFEAWIDLLLRAQYEPTKQLMNGKIMTIGRGQLLTSQVELAAQWHRHREWVKKTLLLLKSDFAIDFETSRGSGIGFTLITIRNYDLYQNQSDNEPTLEPTLETTLEPTLERTLEPTLEPSIKKEDKEDKKNTDAKASVPSSSISKKSKLTRPEPAQVEAFNKFYQAYPRHVGKSDAEKAWLTLNPDPDLIAKIMAAVQRYAEDVQGSEPKYIKHPGPWLNARRWEDEPNGTNDNSQTQDADWRRRTFVNA